MNLVLEGGGIKGLAYIGVFRYFEERGIKVNEVAGTSVGAIMGSLLAVGFDSYEIEEIINDFDLSTLLPSNGRGLKKTYNSIKNKGMYALKEFELFLEAIYLRKGKRIFKDLKIGNNYKLKIVVTELKTKRMIIIPDDLESLGIDADSFSIAKAVCISSSLPIVFEPYKYKEYCFSDGGMAENFPIWIFDDALGVRLNKSTKIGNYVKKKIFKNHNEKISNYIININLTDYKSTEFKRGFNERYILYNRGYYYTKIFFDKLNYDLMLKQ